MLAAGVRRTGLGARAPPEATTSSTESYAVSRSLSIRTDCGTTQDLTADHIVPRSRGGQNVLSNYAVRCRRCNSRRGARFLERQHGDPSASSPREKLRSE